ncbi:PREDICTED: uncharacterized protein LOC104715244 [Camelina sativa]|uniref:Uncharacterized protein LOC104715244 n=1 Tax=Camelina sativa TaxID=90675 RepID=A0ABM1QFF0_CAMSA|nr:PREDICTED: uncharacterized protein LOC104715244 [Camelina sativa]
MNLKGFFWGVFESPGPITKSPSPITVESSAQQVTFPPLQQNDKSTKQRRVTTKKLLGFVNGQIPAPAATRVTTVNDVQVTSPNPAYEAWICTDELIKSWLFGTLSEEVLGLVHAMSTSQEVWLSLASSFNRSSVTRECELLRRLNLLNMKDRTFSVYCREFCAICDNLSAIGKQVNESMKVVLFLNGLAREYDPIATVIQSLLSRLPSCRLPLLMMLFLRFLGLTLSCKRMILPLMFLQTWPSKHNEVVLTLVEGEAEVTSQLVVEASLSRLITLVGISPVEQTVFIRFDNSYQSEDAPQALAALQVSDTCGQEWVTDSGSSAHITAATTQLSTATPYNGSKTVMVADGAHLPITHVGSTTLTTSTSSLPLLDVLVYPSMQKSLLSVSKLCDDYPCGVFFDANAVYVIDLQTQKVVTKGPRRKSLYMLENKEFVALFSNRQCDASDMIWHQRLGHANLQVLQHLKNSKAISSNKSSTSLVCGPCQMGKSCQLPFFSSDFSAKEPIDRIHCDLWGPSPVVSVQGFKYYVVFINAFSRYSWLIPLKTKAEFCDVFIVFQKQVENQFGKKIRIFQSDGGGEFMSTRF